MLPKEAKRKLASEQKPKDVHCFFIGLWFIPLFYLFSSNFANCSQFLSAMKSWIHLIAVLPDSQGNVFLLNCVFFPCKLAPFQGGRTAFAAFSPPNGPFLRLPAFYSGGTWCPAVCAIYNYFLKWKSQNDSAAWLFSRFKLFWTTNNIYVKHS